MKKDNFISVVSFILYIVYSGLVLSCVDNTNSEQKETHIVGKEIGTIKNESDGSVNPVYLYVIDSCEYIGYVTAHPKYSLTHKGKCKFCANRLKK